MAIFERILILIFWINCFLWYRVAHTLSHFFVCERSLSATKKLDPSIKSYRVFFCPSFILLSTLLHLCGCWIIPIFFILPLLSSRDRGITQPASLALLLSFIVFFHFRILCLESLFNFPQILLNSYCRILQVLNLIIGIGRIPEQD